MNNNQDIQYIEAVKGFSLATPEALDKICSFLEIKSSIDAMKKVQRYFATVEMRDPFIEELRLIDKMILSQRATSKNLLLTELFSEDKRVGEAYEDMLSKRLDLPVNYKPPYSLDTLLLSGNFCLSLLGKRNIQSKSMFSGDNALFKAALAESNEITLIKSPGGNSCAIVPEIQNGKSNKISVSDSILFIRAQSSDVKEEQFTSLLAGLIIMNKSSSTVKALKKISDGGLLAALLNTVKGAFVDLSALSQFYNINTDFLITKHENTAIAVISRASIPQFIKSANSYGLSCFTVGRPLNSARINILSGNGGPYSLTTDFIKSLAKKRYVCAKVQNPRLQNQNTTEKFALSTMSSGNIEEYAAAHNGMIITNISSANISFNGTVEAILEAVCRLVASGADYTNILASFDAGISDESEYSLGDGVSMLMGIYRAQAELSLLSSGSQCKITESPYFTATLVAKAPENNIRKNFAKKGSRVYLLAPRYGDDGLPDFRDERLLLSYVNRLSKENAILSARAVGTDGLDPTISKMKTDSVALKITQKGEKAAPGSFIIESDIEISGFLLGYTE